jgi:FkbM family methyltransferase
MRMDVVWNDFIGAEIYYDGVYERGTVELVSALLEPGLGFIDVGAHVGQYTLLASHRVTSSGEVHSFEPTPATFALLSNNVRLNDLRNVRVNAIALSDAERSVSLYLSDAAHEGFNSLRPPYQCDSGRTCQVVCTTLDAYVNKNVSRVDLIKMDVEGAECEVLQGATSLLGSPLRPLILLEFNPGALRAFGKTCGDLAATLAAHYDLFVVEDGVLERYRDVPREHSVFNVLAIPQSRTRDVLRRLERWTVVD